MNGVNDIFWSPVRPGYFFLAGQGINVYKISSAHELSSVNGPVQCSSLGQNKSGVLIASSSLYTNIRSSAWCYEKALNLIAVGLSSGRTSILAFNSNSTANPSSPTNCEVQELVPRHSRAANSVAWNSVEQNLLVTTLDRHRNDPSILVWDVNLAPWVHHRHQNVSHSGTYGAYGAVTKKISNTSTASSDNSTQFISPYSDLLKNSRFLDPNVALPGGSSNGSPNNSNVIVSNRALYEHGQSESVLSGCWFPTQSRTLLAGFQNRGLRIIDLREAQRPARNGPTTKLIRGVCIDRAQENRVAAYMDYSCAIWDLRNAERSLAELTFKRQVSKIEWCPARPGLLAALCRESVDIRLIDVQHSFVSQQECEPYVLERDLRTQEKRPITSFSWSPPHAEDMGLLTTTTSGVVSLLDFSDRLTLNFSDVSNDVLCVSGNHIAHLSTFAGAPVTVQSSTTASSNSNLMLTQRNNAEFYYDSMDDVNLDNFSRTKLKLHAAEQQNKRYRNRNNSIQSDLLNQIATRARFGYGVAPLDSLSNNIAALERASADSTALPESFHQLPRLWKWMQMIFQKYCDKAHAIASATGGMTSSGSAVTSTGVVFNPVYEFSTFTGILSWLSTPVATMQQQQYSSTVRQMPKMSTNLPTSEFTYLTWSDSRITAPVRRYVSRERTRITDICGWTCPGVQSALHIIELVDALADDGQYERAACIALFNLYIQNALSVLQQASTQQPKKIDAARSKSKFLHIGAARPVAPRSDDELHNLAVVAMALAGFATSADNNNNTLWRDLARTTAQKVTQPYLKAMFTFLYEISNEKFDSILHDDRLLLEDRIAFAALYLSDIGLLQFLSKLTVQFVREANVEAMPLLGFSRVGVLLVQRYVNQTGDVQTAAALASLAGTDAWRNSTYVANWIESYRSLLDELRLWHVRAAFDVAKKKLTTLMRGSAAAGHYSMQSSEVPAAAVHTRQIFASCSFCGKSVIHASNVVNSASSSTATTSLTRLQGDKIQRIAVRAAAGGVNAAAGSATGSGGSQTAVVATPSLTGRAWANSSGTTCPNCGKPLPRCTLCELHLGTPPASAGILEATDADLEKGIASKLLRKTAPIGAWFLWCQTCRHGGHTDHMLEWFAKYNECPVTGCACRCATMDGGSGVGSLSIPPSAARASLEFDTAHLNGGGGAATNNFGSAAGGGGDNTRPPVIFNRTNANMLENSATPTTNFAGGSSPGKAVVDDAGVLRERTAGGAYAAAGRSRNAFGTTASAGDEPPPFLCGGEPTQRTSLVPPMSAPPVIAYQNVAGAAAARQAIMVRR